MWYVMGHFVPEHHTEAFALFKPDISG